MIAVLVPVVVAALLATAFGDVWQWLWTRHAVTTPRTPLTTVYTALTSFVFFFVLAQFLPLVRSEHLSFCALAGGVALLASVQHLYPVFAGTARMRSFFVYAGYTVLTVFGGLAVIAYWPW